MRNITAATILVVLMMVSFLTIQSAVAETLNMADYDRALLSKKITKELEEKKVEKITTIWGVDSNGKKVKISLQSLHNHPQPASGGVQPQATCPPLASWEPTSCLWIGWKSAGIEGGVSRTEHCHCYQ